MKCDRFRSGLDDYLAGHLTDDLFVRMIEHEASCVECHLLVESASALTNMDDSIRQMPEAQQAGIHRDIASRRIRGRLLMPSALHHARSRLRADRRFVRDVMNRTAGSPPRFLDVVRALWRRPEATWEAALLCTLLTLLLFGGRLPEWSRIGVEPPDRLRMQAGLVDLGRSTRFGLDKSLRRAACISGFASAEISKVWDQLNDRAEEICDWTERIRDDLRTRDHMALLLQLRVVLEPMGLIYPETLESHGNENPEEPDRLKVDEQRIDGDEERRAADRRLHGGYE